MSTKTENGRPSGSDRTADASLGRDARPSHSHHSHDHGGDSRPLGGYLGLMASYGTLALALTVALRREASRVRLLSPWNFALYALAAEHISRLVTKDSVTAPLRRPFAEFEEAAGEGEVNEDAVGHGARLAVGELLTCPFCFGQWVATGLVAGSVAAPTLTTAVVSVSAIARAADYLQLLYGFLRERVD